MAVLLLQLIIRLLHREEVLVEVLHPHRMELHSQEEALVAVLLHPLMQLLLSLEILEVVEFQAPRTVPHQVALHPLLLTELLLPVDLLVTLLEEVYHLHPMELRRLGGTQVAGHLLPVMELLRPVEVIAVAVVILCFLIVGVMVNRCECVISNDARGDE